MCRDMYRVMPYAYPPVVGGQQGGAGTDPEPTQNLPYDLTNLTISYRDSTDSKANFTPSKDNTASWYTGIIFSGVEVLNSELASKCTAKIAITVSKSPTVKFVKGSSSYDGTSKYLWSYAYCRTTKLEGIMQWTLYCPKSMPSGEYAIKVTAGSYVVQSLVIYGPDGEVLQEWTP